ncbi:MAG: oligosaccharide flippase family protein, partial [Aggregatilineales bacterium]
MRPTLRRLLPDALITFGLFALPLIILWQVTLGGKTLLPADNLYQYPPWTAYRAQLGVPDVPHNALLSDLVLENLEWKTFTRQAIASRELPLWNPYLFAGTPFLAEGQHSALYPFSLIYYILPLDRAYGWFTVSQLWLAGLLMYLFMRGLGTRRIGALCAAIAYELSAFFLASVVFQMIIAAAAWLPFLLLMIEFIIRQHSLFGRSAVIPWIALGSIGLGMCILAGHVEILYYSLLVMGFWAVCRLIGPLRAALKNRAAFGPLAKTALALLSLVVIGLGVGAIQFVPLYELAGQNFRAGSESFDTVRSYAYPPRHALEFLIPNLYGSPAQHSYFDLFGGGQKPFQWQRSDNQTVTDTYWEVNKNYVEGACYVGLLTLILAAIALFDALRNKRNPFRGITVVLASLSVISLAFVFGTPLYALLYYGLPGVNQLHSPFRWVFPLTLALAALAGFGADVLSRALTPTPLRQAREGLSGNIDSPPLSAARERLPDIATPPLHFVERGSGGEVLTRPLGHTLIIAGALFVVALLLSRLFYARLEGGIDALLHKLAGADTQFSNVATFYSVEFPNLMLFGLFLIASGCVVRVSRCPIYLPRWLGKRPIWEAMAVTVIALDLIAATWGFNPAADPAWLHFTPPPIAWLQAHDPQSWRFTVIDAGSKPLNANVGWLFGLQDISGYDSIIPKQYVDYMQGLQPQGMLIYNRIATPTADHLETIDSPLLDQLSVKYIVSETPIDLSAHPKYRQVYADGGVTIYENTQVWPRAVILTTPNAVLPWSLATATITAATMDQVMVNVATWNGSGARPTWLRLSDSYASGWRAYLKPQGADDSHEQEIPIALAGGNFRQVEVPPGAWTVRFRYSPRSFQVGAFGTFTAGLLIIFMLLIWLWRRFYAEGGASDSGVRRIAKNSGAPVILSLFNRAIDFGFAVVMLRILSVADAGVYYYAVVVIGWFDILTNFGLNTFLTRDVARNPGAAAFYLRRTSLIRLALAVAWLPALALFVLIQPLHPALDSTTLIVIGLLYLSLIPSSLNSGLSALFYAFEKAEIPAAVSTGTAIVSVITRLGVLLAGFGIIGLAGASVALNLFTLAVLVWQALPLLRATRANQTPSTRPVSYRFMLIEAWPLMLNHLLATIFFKIDVTLL